MNFSPYKISENFIKNKLNFIKGGSLNLTNYNKQNQIFGETNNEINADIQIQNPKFYF